MNNNMSLKMILRKSFLDKLVDILSTQYKEAYNYKNGGSTSL